MRYRVPPVALVVGALLADGGGAHDIGFYLLVAAVPAAAIAALSLFGALVDLPRGDPSRSLVRLEATLAGLGLVLLVIAAAARGNAPRPDDIPALGISALVAVLAIFAAQGLAVAAAELREREPSSS